MGIPVIEVPIPFREVVPVLLSGLLVLILVKVVACLRPERKRVGAAVMGTLLGLLAAVLNEAFGPPRTCSTTVAVPHKIRLSNASSGQYTDPNNAHLFTSLNKSRDVLLMPEANSLTNLTGHQDSKEHIGERCDTSARARSYAVQFILWLLMMGVIVAKLYFRRQPQQQVHDAPQRRPIQRHLHERAWG
ncbi:uncharacterized protein LOC144135351 [Amblyomma americanum]